MWSDLLLISNCTSATYWRTWNELLLVDGECGTGADVRGKAWGVLPRQLVARWFRRELGISVEEYDPRATPQFDLF